MIQKYGAQRAWHIAHLWVFAVEKYLWWPLQTTQMCDFTCTITLWGG